jgi:hypothetical protein
MCVAFKSLIDFFSFCMTRDDRVKEVFALVIESSSIFDHNASQSFFSTFARDCPE